MPEQAIGRIHACGPRVTVHRGGLEEGLAGHDQAEHVLHIPTTLDKLHRQPVEQFGVRRRFTPDAEVFLGRDDPATQQLGPKTVHGDPGDQGVFVAHQPLREPETVLRGILESRKQAGCRRWYRCTRCEETAPLENVGGARFIAFPHDQGATIVSDLALFLLFGVRIIGVHGLFVSDGHGLAGQGEIGAGKAQGRLGLFV